MALLSNVTNVSDNLSLTKISGLVRVPRLLLRTHPPSVLVTPCPLLEKENCHHEGADLREVRFPSGWGHEPIQGLSLPGHLAPQRPSAAAQREELWLRLVPVCLHMTYGSMNLGLNTHIFQPAGQDIDAPIQRDPH